MDSDKLTPPKLKYKLIYSGAGLSIRGKCFVASYDENTLILKCGKESVCITGSNLVITSMNIDGMCVGGTIGCISFE